MGSCSELHAKFWDGANSSSGFMSKPSEVREFCTELMQSHKLSKCSVDWPNCVFLRKGGSWSKSLRENELSFKQNSRLCKFYIISAFTASTFRTLSLSFCPENGPGPQCSSERLAEDQLRSQNLPSFSCTKFHIFLRQSTHSSVMSTSLNRHTCRLVDLMCHFPHSNVQSRFSHNWTQKTERDAIICLGKRKASQCALGAEDQRLRNNSVNFSKTTPK